jgi:hypothetical protein
MARKNALGAGEEALKNILPKTTVLIGLALWRLASKGSGRSLFLTDWKDRSIIRPLGRS